MRTNPNPAIHMRSLGQGQGVTRRVVDTARFSGAARGCWALAPIPTALHWQYQAREQAHSYWVAAATPALCHSRAALGAWADVGASGRRRLGGDGGDNQGGGGQWRGRQQLLCTLPMRSRLRIGGMLKRGCVWLSTVWELGLKGDAVSRWHTPCEAYTAHIYPAWAYAAPRVALTFHLSGCCILALSSASFQCLTVFPLSTYRPRHY